MMMVTGINTVSEAVKKLREIESFK
jgi:hypothetical protein